MSDGHASICPYPASICPNPAANPAAIMVTLFVDPPKRLTSFLHKFHDALVAVENMEPHVKWRTDGSHFAYYTYPTFANTHGYAPHSANLTRIHEIELYEIGIEVRVPWLYQWQHVSLLSESCELSEWCGVLVWGDGWFHLCLYCVLWHISLSQPVPVFHTGRVMVLLWGCSH